MQSNKRLFKVLTLISFIFLLEFILHYLSVDSNIKFDKCKKDIYSCLRLSNPYNIGLSQFDIDLGYVPSPGFKAHIQIKSWSNSYVEINEMGFRSNNNNVSYKNNKKIIAVGDSFTFGDQVSNDFTWPSILERNLKIKVDNGGVFGYGAAQSLKRLEKITFTDKYEYAIFSILVGSDVSRDRYMYRSGFPRPSVIEVDGNLMYSNVPFPHLAESKYNPSHKDYPLLSKCFNYIYICRIIMLNLNINPINDRLSLLHPNAADESKIIDWIVKKFLEVEVPKKIILLQYSKNLNEKEIQDERKLILKIAEKYKIKVIDTYAILESVDEKKYWFGHHTKLGNKLVADYISNHLEM